MTCWKYFANQVLCPQLHLVIRCTP